MNMIGISNHALMLYNARTLIFERANQREI